MFCMHIEVFLILKVFYFFIVPNETDSFWCRNLYLFLNYKINS